MFRTRFHLAVAAIAAASLLSIAGAAASLLSDGMPPANAKPLSEIVRAIEAQSLGIIVEIEFEDGVWEIELHRPDGSEVTLKIDPVSGREVSRS